MSTPESTWGSHRVPMRMRDGTTQLVEATPVTQPPREAKEFKAGDIGFIALGDRVIILEDDFRSGYECKTCGGHGNVKCTECDNGKSRLNPEMKCKNCTGALHVVCPDCGGKGGLIVIPDQNKRRPSTGLIVSAGELCKVLTEGENVVYSNFAGIDIDLNIEGREVTVRILHETEVLSKVTGHLALRMLKAKREATSI
jgi:co-chaperonin GroES (HSP10)